MRPFDLDSPLVLLAAILSVAVACAPLWRVVMRLLCAAWDRSRGNRTGRYVFLFFVGGATLFAGAKHALMGTISFPYTDPEVRYIYDAGSYVTNDAVHVAYTRMIAPLSAPLFVDYRQVGSTNDEDWVTFTNTTFAAFPSPQDIAFAAATNYNWIVYTTWTPGPSVRTNGVWHAYWGVDRKEGKAFIPVRTCVRENGLVIATPKSVWNAATNTTNEVEE